MPYPYFNEAQMSFQNFQEQQRQPETFQSIYGKMNIQVIYLKNMLSQSIL